MCDEGRTEFKRDIRNHEYPVHGFLECTGNVSAAANFHKCGSILGTQTDVLAIFPEYIEDVLSDESAIPFVRDAEGAGMNTETEFPSGSNRDKSCFNIDASPLRERESNAFSEEGLPIAKFLERDGHLFELREGSLLGKAPVSDSSCEECAVDMTSKNIGTGADDGEFAEDGACPEARAEEAPPIG